MGTLINELRHAQGMEPITQGDPPTKQGIIARLEDELRELSGGDKAKELEILSENPEYFRKLLPKGAVRSLKAENRRHRKKWPSYWGD